MLKLDLSFVKRFAGFLYPPNGYVGCSLSHLWIIGQAIQLEYKNVLVFEDDAQVLNNVNLEDLDNALWQFLS